MLDKGCSLNKEISINVSGKLKNEHLIPVLKEQNYRVRLQGLTGDAPKQFIKAYFYEPKSTVRKRNPKSWIPYIAKTAEKWYPHESVIEYMINRLGVELGLVMNDIRLVRANGQIRFLSRFFLKENERLIHGAEICGEHLNDMVLAEEIANNKKSSRELFTFEFIKEAIKVVYPSYNEKLTDELVKMIAFDAIVGNNDRHFYNWGVIDTLYKSKKAPIFAPIFDSARGLLWNYSDENIKKHYEDYCKNGTKIVNYIEAACPRISIEQNKNANHFDLIAYLKNDSPAYKTSIEKLSSVHNEEKILRMLRNEFSPFFIKERSNLLEIILRNRIKKIREV